MKKLTPSQENYLEWIYRFSSGGDVKIRDIAEKLCVKIPSVSRAVSNLEKLGLVNHEAYGSISLTHSGKKVGECIVKRDDCLTTLLVDILNMSPDDADPHVHQLEHVVGEDVVSRLEILVEFCLSSEAWLKRLHHRIETNAYYDDDCDYLIGSTNVHAGAEHEKKK